MAVSQTSRAETLRPDQIGRAPSFHAEKTSHTGVASRTEMGSPAGATEFCAGETRGLPPADEKHQRIDSRHQKPRPTACVLPLERAAAPIRSGEEIASGGEKNAGERSPAAPASRLCPDRLTAATPSARDAWLKLQAADLIDRLQSWSDQLDQHEIQLHAREAALNTRAAVQDQRERRFRMQQQEGMLQLEEQERSIEQLRQRIEAQARRLAFA